MKKNIYFLFLATLRTQRSKISKHLLTIFTLFVITLLAACSNFIEVSKNTPLHKWPEDMLIAKGKDEFEKKNFPASLRYLKEAARRDNKEALYALGYMYYYGIAMPRNINLAQDLIRRSAALDHKPAIRALRLFIATRSSLTVDSDSASYLSHNQQVSPAAPPLENKLSQLTDVSKPSIPASSKQPIQNNPAFNTQEIKEKQIVATKQHVAITPDNTELKKFPQKQKLQVAQVTQTKKTVPVKKADSTKITPNTVAKNKHLVVTKQNSQTEKAKPLSNNKIIIREKTIKIAKTNQTATKKTIQLKQKDLSADTNKGWLNLQKPDDYTIQVSSFKTHEDVLSFIKNNQIDNKANIFSYLYKGQRWYSLGYGVYSKPDEAYSAMLNDMPPALTAKNPWVRQFKNIYQEKALG